MPKNRPPTYTPAPDAPSDPEIRRRYEQILAVIAQRQSVTNAARALGMSRNHFQTLLHRGIAALIEAITPKPAGRPTKSGETAALEMENERLRAQVESLTTRSEVIERMMNVVGEIASGKTRLPRSRSKKTKTEDPEPARSLTEVVTTMRDARVPTRLCSRVLGVSASTVRRRRHPRPAMPRTQRMVSDAACRRVREVVRATHGLVGASNLGKMCGLSRRSAASIKRRELREMELERKALCASVTIAAPGIVRGFDAMHVRSVDDGKMYWLVAADAAVPYRTSIATVPTYDAEHVIAALAADFEAYGPPLVVRLDRIACQRTPDVERLLDRHHVLALHGPPRHARYYGQLERQNREHRAWYEQLAPVSTRDLRVAGEHMRTSLNTLWPRHTLGGWTADQAWRRRMTLDVNRRELRCDVERRTSGLVTSGVELLRARRIAIESALIERGLLTIKQGGWR
jgi:hypothetical protein